MLGLKPHGQRAGEAPPQGRESVHRFIRRVEEVICPGPNCQPTKIPGAVKAVIPDAGHAANLDQPAAFNAAVRAFLDALPTP